MCPLGPFSLAWSQLVHSLITDIAIIANAVIIIIKPALRLGYATAKARNSTEAIIFNVARFHCFIS